MKKNNRHPNCQRPDCSGLRRSVLLELEPGTASERKGTAGDAERYRTKSYNRF